MVLKRGPLGSILWVGSVNRWVEPHHPHLDPPPPPSAAAGGLARKATVQPRACMGAGAPGPRRGRGQADFSLSYLLGAPRARGAALWPIISCTGSAGALPFWSAGTEAGAGSCRGKPNATGVLPCWCTQMIDTTNGSIYLDKVRCTV